MIVNTDVQYTQFIERLNRELHVCTPIFRDIYLHPHVNELYCMIYTFVDGETYTVSITSKDAPTFPVPSPTVHTFTTSPWVGGYDLTLLAYLRGIEFTNIKEYYTNHIRTTHTFFENVRHINRVIPITVWATVGHTYHQQMISLVENYHTDVTEPTFITLNRACGTLRDIETSGVFVDTSLVTSRYGGRVQQLVHHNMLYTQYNPYTMTGRPSNRFNGINFAALAKHDGSRKMFTSRFTQGTLLQFDFDAYHLRLLGEYANVTLPMTPLHEYLGALYFNKSPLSTEEYDRAKQQTFHILYGEDVETDIELLQQIKCVADTVYDEYRTHGHIQSPVFGRTMYIKEPHISKNKAFNYFVQSLEFERTSVVLEKLCTYLAQQQSRCILYTYDAVLLDVHPAEYDTVHREVRSILEREEFPVKMYTGKNYHDMEKL